MDNPVNFTAKAALFRAFFEAVAVPFSDGSKGSWFKGVHWWVWLTDPATGGVGDYRNLYTPQVTPPHTPPILCFSPPPLFFLAVFWHTARTGAELSGLIFGCLWSFSWTAF